MKSFKIIPAITFGLVLVSYLVFSTLFSDNEAEKLMDENDVVFIQNLSEDEQGVLINFSQEEMKNHEHIPDSIKSVLLPVDSEKFTQYQSIVKNRTDLAQYLNNGIRLILLLFLFFGLLIEFQKKYNYRITFSKVMFEAVKKVLLFILFVVSSTLLTQMIFGETKDLKSNIVLQGLFIQALQLLKTGGLYAVGVSIIIYFHPQNIARQIDKQKRLEKQQNKKAAQ